MRLLQLFTLGLSFSAATAFAQPNQTPTTVINPPLMAPPVFRVPRPVAPKDQIEFDLKTLIGNLNGLSAETPEYSFSIPASILGGRIGFFGLSEWTNYFLEERGKTQYRIDQVEVEKLETDAARVKVVYSLLTPNRIWREDKQQAEEKIDVAHDEETVDLKREIVSWDKTERWRIVPPTADTLQHYRPLSLQHIAYFASQRAETLPQLRAEISVSHLKHAALGVLQFVQDYDEQFAFQNDFWRRAVQPYVQKDAVFLIPGTLAPYTFNDNLSGKDMAAVGSPAQTVLFYEGEGEKPTFRYSGQAAICFVDGHVKLVSPESAKSLIWKP